MELLSNTQFNIHKYYGNIVLVYFENDEPYISSIKEKLDYVGYQYNCIPIGPSLLSRRYFVSDTDKILDECACLMVILNNEFDRPENLVYKNVLWYCVGYVNSIYHESIIPIKVNHVKPLDLKGTPIQHLNIVDNQEELMETLSNKYSSRLLCYNYYLNRKINFYASKRIYYRNLNFKFKIYENCFQNALHAYYESTGLKISENEFEKLLIDKLTCGCRVVSFGRQEDITPELFAYKDEVIEFEKNDQRSITGKKQYILTPKQEAESTGIRAVLFMDILLPVHKILGTYFKCYMKLDDGYSDLNPILALLLGDFYQDQEFIKKINKEFTDWEKYYPKETFANREKNRLYFSSGLTVTEYTSKKLNIGNFVDYIYPQ